MYPRTDYIRGFKRFEIQVFEPKYGTYTYVVWARSLTDAERKAFSSGRERAS